MTSPKTKGTIAIPASVNINLATVLGPKQYVPRWHDPMTFEKTIEQVTRTIEL